MRKKIHEYQHDEQTHNMRAPEIIAPLLYSLIRPASIIDIGCGIGTFLFAFKRLGVSEVMGLDGDWVNENLREKYLGPAEFKSVNLAEFVDVKKKYDLAICLEVAEHIEENCSENLIKTLVNASDVIAFSAASPFQQGQHHLNEQWPNYWIDKFSKYDFYFHDILRPSLWNDNEVDFWYKQNIFLVTHEKYILDKQRISELRNVTFNNMIHPDLFIKKSKYLIKIIEGNMSTAFYIRLLIKKFLNKTGVYMNLKNRIK